MTARQSALASNGDITLWAASAFCPGIYMHETLLLLLQILIKQTWSQTIASHVRTHCTVSTVLLGTLPFCIVCVPFG